jgi:hypothetical protein
MRKGLNMTLEQVEAHQRKHGFFIGVQSLKDRELSVDKPSDVIKVLKPRMNKTEREYSLILEAMKRRGEIIEFRAFGIALEWGLDPDTQKPMRYRPDFIAWRHSPSLPIEVVIIEVKGGHIYSRDLVRFKGCRSDWPMFAFEMHQKKAGQWNRIL